MSTAERDDYIARVRQNVPEQLLGVAAWLLWRWPEKGRKIPFYSNGDARNGQMDAAEDRSQLVEFETAAKAYLADRSFYGLGLALGEVPGEEMQLAGIDLDDVCSGEAIDPRAAKILEAANSYAERSPSLKGVKIFGCGAIGTTGKVSDDGAGLEIYDGKRFFAVTGLRLNGAHLGDLTEASILARALFHVGDKKKPPPAQERYSDGTEDIGAIALANLEKWVPALLPTAQLRPDGTWRATAKSLGRDTEEDLVCASGGCMDYGASHATSKENAGRSPVQLVMEHNQCEFQRAMDWLRARLHLPAFKGHHGPSKNSGRDPGNGRATQTGSADPQASQALEAPAETEYFADLGSGTDENVSRLYTGYPQEEWVAPEKDPWGTPIDLWSDRPVPRLNPQWLPGALAPFVADQAALTGTDPTIAGVACLVACAGVIHDGFRVQPKAHDTGWTESARLWAVIVGDPSTKKSPAIDRAIAPLKKIEAQLAAVHKDTRRDFEEALSRWERGKGSDKGAAPEKPCEPRVLVNDTTIESLSDIMKDNARGVMVYRDELSGWFGSMDVYGKNGSDKDRAFWLEAYNGGQKRIDRVTRGHILVENCSACLLGGIQPTVFAKRVRNMEEDGLLQRFMVVIAGSATDDEDRAPNVEALLDYHRLIERLYGLVPTGSQQVFTLSEEAQSVRRVCMMRVRGMINSRAASGPMLGYLGKWDGLFGRLMCVFHLISNIDFRGVPAVIEGHTAMCVCQFMECLLLPHASEFYDNLMHGSERLKMAQWIAGWILSKDAKEFATRDISGASRPFFNLAEQEQRAVWSMLEAGDWIRSGPAARVNKRSLVPTRWEVNPLVHEVYAARARTEKVSRAAIKQVIADTVERIRRERDNP